MKLKSLFLTSVLSLLFVSGAFAQDKYEYLTVALSGSKIVVTSATEVNAFAIEKGVSAESQQLKKVEELNQQGWELFNTTTTAVGSWTYYQFYLRKKKN